MSVCVSVTVTISSTLRACLSLNNRLFDTLTKVSDWAGWRKVLSLTVAPPPTPPEKEMELCQIPATWMPCSPFEKHSHGKKNCWEEKIKLPENGACHTKNGLLFTLPIFSPPTSVRVRNFRPYSHIFFPPPLSLFHHFRTVDPYSLLFYFYSVLIFLRPQPIKFFVLLLSIF